MPFGSDTPGMVNVGMAISLMPVTGIPLPFISHGGSSLVSICFALGVLQSVSMRRAGPELFEQFSIDVYALLALSALYAAGKGVPADDPEWVTVAEARRRQLSFAGSYSSSISPFLRYPPRR